MLPNVIFTSIRELGERLRTGALSPIALTQLFLERLETLGPHYNAVVTTTRDRAMAQAQWAEAEIASGHYRGPLHGIPYGAKDLIATSGGIPTTWGAAPFRNQTFDDDATVIQKLEASGAILVAKLAMVELAGGMGYFQPHASFTGPCRNPWNPNTWSGGSSSGSGAAVSGGLVPFAIGSETFGSILSPANNCGVAGLRPTYGRVSRFGAMALCWTLDKLGPLCLTADDCGLVLDAIAGPDPADPTASQQVFTYDAEPVGRRFKLGVPTGITDEVEEYARRHFEQALEVLSEVATIDTVSLPDLPYEAITRTILAAEAASAFDEFIDRGQAAELTAPEDHYGPYARTAILATDYIRALRLRGRMARDIDALFEGSSGFDALLGPSRWTPATGIDENFRSPVHGNAPDVLGAIGNGAGLPAISVPNGFTPQGLPTGIQFMGRAYAENTVLAIARAYQGLTDWHQRHPPHPS
ncbi:amidase [Candidatus Entotheonella palauensis]|uniref:Amidase n=1 Tax=Candidatus Entotheonella gemina TaxID=1429439 RepID=W4LZC6_9BACT|nr:amidase [Candidatus Entotheonella palauensis]ETX03439.1 MAG: amidase [Candidatus Entotheonella gemina]